MKWEYACIQARYEYNKTTYTLYSSNGQQEIQADGAVVMLNQLGQDGWEVLGVDIAVYNNATERTFWLKRSL
jgi:hypothetical protein